MNQEGSTSRKSISLVLGSGGARGYAHIGAIEELLAQGYEIRSIAGSSMGALVGGVYAAGKLDEFRDWVLGLARFDVFKLLDITMRGGGFIKGTRVINLLREMVGDVDIEGLPITYTAVAVDLDAHREVWFTRGSLFEAIRASISIPTIFRPHQYQGRLLVDGGLLNPLPVSPTLRDLTEATIAIDVNGMDELLEVLPEQSLDEPLTPNATRRQLRRFGSWFAGGRGGQSPDPGFVELFARSLDTVQETITRLKLAAQPPDLLISIPRNISTFYEFHRAREIIELGRQRTREALQRWV